MKYRQFGNTELKVSEIGFGAWAIGGPANVGGVEIGWGQSDDGMSRQAIHAALDAGINFFDTADFYGLGHSEKLLGDTIGNRPDIIMATKVGQRVGADGKIAIDYSKNYVIEACEHSLKRLQRDAIDYYQLHVARLHHLQSGECVDAMQTLQRQGKIRYWGISLNTFVPEPEAEWMLDNHMGQGFQLVLNVINQLALPVLAMAKEKGYGVIARMPLQFGLLSGNIKPETQFSKADHRSYRITNGIASTTLALLEKHLAPMASRYQTPLSALALSFILGFDAVSTVIPGIRTAHHVQLNTNGLVQLTQEDHQYLQEQFTPEFLPLLDTIKMQG